MPSISQLFADTTPVAANDNHASARIALMPAIPVPVAGNDSKPRGRRSSMATYARGDARVTFFRLDPAVAADLGIHADDRVRVDPIKLIDVAAGGMASGFRIAKFPTGQKVRRDGGRLLIQGWDLSDTVSDASAVRLMASEGGLVVAPMGPGELRTVPDYLESITRDTGWERRRAMLAANDNTPQVTAAGDECYTARFIVNAALEAARQEAFDIDVCSMRADGRYDLAMPSAPKVCSWGSTPEKLRRLADVIGHVPAKRHFTNDAAFGSLARDWDGKLIWCNPPYSLRSWATFLEKAQHEVDVGHAGIVVALVPSDNTGLHTRHLRSQDAYQIELIAQIPFYKREKVMKDGSKAAIVEAIRGNQFVVFGKGRETREFLVRFVTKLWEIGYISDNHCAHYLDQYAVAPRLAA